MATPTLEEHALAAGKAFPWHEVYVPDKQKAIEFYTKCLDFGTQEFDMGEGAYTMLTRDGKGVAGIMDTTQPPLTGMDIPPHWIPYLAVDDVDKKIELCKANGAEVVAGPMDVPSVGRMVLIADPLGAHIWLYKDSSS